MEQVRDDLRVAPRRTAARLPPHALHAPRGRVRARLISKEEAFGTAGPSVSGDGSLEGGQ